MPTIRMHNRLTRQSVAHALLATIFVATCIGGAGIVVHYASRYDALPLDSYYYLDMADHFARSGVPASRLGQGVGSHFMPGYPILLGTMAWLARRSVESVWPVLQAFLAIVVPTLLTAVILRRGIGKATAIAAGALLGSNPIFLKWTALPMSEASGVAVVLVAALLWPSRTQANSARAVGRAAMAGLVAGVAFSIRPDTLPIAVLLPILVARGSLTARFRSRWNVPVALYLACAAAAAAFCVWMQRLLAPTSDSYLAEAATEATGNYPPNVFFELFMKLWRQPNVLHPWPTINLFLIVISLLFCAGFFSQLRGYFGRASTCAAWCLFVYLGAHSFWYYPSERFNLPALPLAAPLMAATLAWMADRRAFLPERSSARFLFVLLVFTTCCVQLAYAPVAILDHASALFVQSGNPRKLAAFADATTSSPENTAREDVAWAWSESAIGFQYYYKGFTYIDAEVSHFSRRTVTDPKQFFTNHPVRWVIVRRPSREVPADPAVWFSKHPQITTATITLIPRATDQVFDIFAVQYRDKRP